MATWEVKNPVKGMGYSWRDKFPELNEKVERIKAPYGRGIAWEGTEIYAYKDRAQNITEYLLRNIEKFPDKEAYMFHPSGVRFTWKEVGDKVNEIAYSLRHKFEFKNRERLALLTEGGPEFLLSYLAVAQLGGISVPVNLGLSPEGIAAQINKVRAKYLVVNQEMWNRLQSVKQELKYAEVVFVTNGEQKNTETIPFSELYTDEQIEDLVREDVDEWDLLAITFTSGTTGSPKGSMKMHTNAIGCMNVASDMLGGLTKDDVNICMPPLYHATGIYSNILPSLLVGAKSVIMNAFDPLEAIKLIEKEKATFAAAAPIMFSFIMNHPDFHQYDCSTFKKFAFGGHAASETFIRQLIKTFSPVAVVNAGSVSESTALGFALPTEDAIRKITSCGLATPCTEIAIFDEDGNEITEPNKIGEVGYKGQQTTAGYWEEEERTKETFRKDGYVLSGDWAKLDEEGYLWLLDRKKDMIVRGGQNVYCIGVENVLYQNDKIQRAAVVGVPDHLFAERVKAVVVLKPGETSSPDEIREYCRRHLANYEVPEYVVFADQLPTNPAGKTLKPPLVDFWGKIERDDDVLGRFRSYMASLPENLLNRELIKFNNAYYTPRQVYELLQNNSEIGKLMYATIAQEGIVRLLKPDEARFRRTESFQN